MALWCLENGWWKCVNRDLMMKKCTWTKHKSNFFLFDFHHCNIFWPKNKVKHITHHRTLIISTKYSTLSNCSACKFIHFERKYPMKSTFWPQISRKKLYSANFVSQQQKWATQQQQKTFCLDSFSSCCLPASRTKRAAGTSRKCDSFLGFISKAEASS